MPFGPRATGIAIILCVITGAAVWRESRTAQAAPPPKTFDAAFWYWGSYERPLLVPGLVADSLYVQAGTWREPAERGTGPVSRFQIPYEIYDSVPVTLPKAKTYWFVFRYDSPGVPPVADGKLILRAFNSAVWEGTRRGLAVSGLQLDVDSPTGKLSEYGALLKEVRTGLAQKYKLSITALPDWFRDGTSIETALAPVDEFVPQFYDLDPDQYRSAAIAAKFDGARWGPVFGRFRKPFRIGISTFGRSTFVSAQQPGSGQYLRAVPYSDLTLASVANDPGFELQTSRNEAGERVLRYRAKRAGKKGYNGFAAGDTFVFTLATPEMVRDAVKEARKAGPYAAGVAFFRWPTRAEDMVLQPAEVLEAGGFAGGASSGLRVEATPSTCAAVYCVEVFLHAPAAIRPAEARYIIRTNHPMEYFAPAEGSGARLTGPGELSVRYQPFAGRGRALLGTAVSDRPLEFSVEQVP